MPHWRPVFPCLRLSLYQPCIFIYVSHISRHAAIPYLWLICCLYMRIHMTCRVSWQYCFNRNLHFTIQSINKWRNLCKFTKCSDVITSTNSIFIILISLPCQYLHKAANIHTCAQAYTSNFVVKRFVFHSNYPYIFVIQIFTDNYQECTFSEYA